MDPISTAALTGLLTVAADAAKDPSSRLATAAWKDIKDALGWTSEPAPGEIAARAEATLTADCTLGCDVDQIVRDYTLEIGRERAVVAKGNAAAEG